MSLHILPFALLTEVRSVLSGSLLLLAVVCTLAVSQDMKYLVYDEDLTPDSVYRSRRYRLVGDLGTGAVAIFFSAPERPRNGDTNYPYRQDDNFYYLTGFNEPASALLLSAEGIALPSLSDSTAVDTVHEILFVRPHDVRRERWSGRRFGVEGAMSLLGLTRAMTLDKLGAVFRKVTSSRREKSFWLGTIPPSDSYRTMDWFRPVRAFVDSLRRDSAAMRLADPDATVRRYRSVKSPEEIKLIAKAAHISAVAHRQAMMSCIPGMSEFELQAVYEYVFRKMGSEQNAYPCIVGSGENSVILHYDSNRRRIHDGDIVLADCGAEYHNYASDVTRTFPANGKFSPAQRELYAIVLDAQKEAIAVMKPGVLWTMVTAKADSVLENGLFALGIIKEKNNRDFRKFYPHGLGHAVGLDVHDTGAPLMMPGMVYTIEPGIYIPENIAGVDSKYANLGVRIEDDILITPDGHVVLSDEAPREIDEIEALMKANGIGNVPME